VLRIASAVVVLAAAVAVVAGAAEADKGKGNGKPKSFPEVIQLPTGFQPEGIEIGKGTTFYTGSVANGAIYRGDLRTGKGAILAPGATGRSATGIELASRDRLVVAGAATGNAYIFDARKGTLLQTIALATAPTFINDVVVTRDAAYFTDSQKPVIYKVTIGKTIGAPQTITLSGDYTHVAGQFNLNGIDASSNGKALVAVQSANGTLYRIDPRTGVAKKIDLGTESVPNGDGILLDGRTLYVVQNRDNKVAVIDLARDLASGTLRTRLTDPDFDVPTTMDELGKRLYAVNARFGTANPPATSAYQVVQFNRR
jgi:sugar lactone lactonase YvrE